MILSDRDIKEYLKNGKLAIENMDEENIQAGWVDLTLGNEFRLFKATSQPYIDVKSPENETEKIEIKDNENFIIHPGEFVLGQIREKIKIPSDLAAYVDGRSSLGRIGLVVHVTSGFVDPGYKGPVTLELSNLGHLPVTLYPLMRVAAIAFMQITGEAGVYGSKKASPIHPEEKVDLGHFNSPTSEPSKLSEDWEVEIFKRVQNNKKNL